MGLLARIIHVGFCYNRRYVATTSLTAGGLAARSVNILLQVCLPPVAGSALEPASPTPTRAPSPLVESPRRGRTPFGTPMRGNAPASRLRAPVSLDVSAVSLEPS